MNLSSRGLRDLDSGPERITDERELAQVRAQARKVLSQALLAGALLTALSLALPTR